MSITASYLEPSPGEIEEYAASLELMAAKIREGILPLPAEGRAVSFQIGFHGPGSTAKGAELAGRLDGDWPLAGTEETRFARRTGRIGCLEVSVCAFEPRAMAETASAVSA